MAEAATEWSPISGCTEPCPLHAHHILKFYRPKHNTFACGNCLIDYHEQCECDYIPDIANGYKDSDEVRTFREKIDKIGDRIENMTTDSSEKVLNDIQNYRTEINAVLDKCKGALGDKICHTQTKLNARTISDIEDKKRSETQDQSIEPKLTKHVEDDVKVPIQTHDERNKPNIIFMEHISLQEKNVPPNTYMLKRNETFDDLLHSKSNVLGNIIKSGQHADVIDSVATGSHGDKTCATAEKSTQTSESVEEGDTQSASCGAKLQVTDNSNDAESSVIHPDRNRCSINFANLVIMDSITAKVSSSDFISDITGIDCVQFGKLVFVDSKQKCIALVDTLSRRILRFKRLNTKPFDVASLPQNQAAVTFPFEKSFEIFSIRHEFNNLYHVKKVSVDGECYGVAYKAGNLVMTFQNPPKIQILNQNGIVYKLFNPTTEGRRLLEYPYYVSVTHDVDSITNGSNDAIFVTDRFRNIVVKLSMNGEVLFSLKQSTKYSNMHFAPKGICPAGGGNVLVCYDGIGETMVSLVSHDGHVLRKYLHRTNKFFHPCTLAYNQTNERLYVTSSTYDRPYNQHRCNCIEVFKIFGDSVV